MSGRRGFSLIDLLVVVAVIAVLLALLIPATKKVRAASERLQSTNNLKQVMLAAYAYETDKGVFPPLCDFGKGASTEHGVTNLFFELLPYLDQEKVHALFDKNSPATYYDATNGVAKAQVDVFISPLDKSAVGNVTAVIDVTDPTAAAPFAATFSGTYATTSYAGNGTFFRPEMKVANITDGTATTITFAERYRVCKKSDKKDDVVYNLWGLGAYGASMPSFAMPLPTEAKYPTAKPALEQFVPTSPVPAKGNIAGRVGNKLTNYADVGKSSSAPGGFQVMPSGTVPCDPRIPQALQPGGLTVAFCDGSVRTLAATISPNIFWALITPDGGEDVGGNW